MISESTREILQSYYNLKVKSEPVSHKRKLPIYKHVAIRKHNSSHVEPKLYTNQGAAEINSPLKSRSISYNFCKACEKLSPSKEAVSPKQSLNVELNFEGSPLAVALQSSLSPSSKRKKIKTSTYFPNFLLSTNIKPGTRVSDPAKLLLLEQISSQVLSNASKYKIKCFYNEPDKIYNIMPVGDSAPLSQCCNSNLVIQISFDYGGRVICTSRNCFIKYLCNFILEKSEINILWAHSVPIFPEKKQRKSYNSFRNPIKKLDSIREKMQVSKNSIFNTQNAKFSFLGSPLNQLLLNKNKFF